MKLMTLKVPDVLYHRLQQYILVSGKNQSEIVRESLQEFLCKQHSSKSATILQAASKWKGIVSLNSDLSTNKKYLEGFGK